LFGGGDLAGESGLRDRRKAPRNLNQANNSKHAEHKIAHVSPPGSASAHSTPDLESIQWPPWWGCAAKMHNARNLRAFVVLGKGGGSRLDEKPAVAAEVCREDPRTVGRRGVNRRVVE